jgi:hypothetical protein
MCARQIGLRRLSSACGGGASRLPTRLSIAHGRPLFPAEPFRPDDLNRNNRPRVRREAHEHIIQPRLPGLRCLLDGFRSETTVQAPHPGSFLPLIGITSIHAGPLARAALFALVSIVTGADRRTEKGRGSGRCVIRQAELDELDRRSPSESAAPFIAAYNENAKPFAWKKNKVHQRRFKGRRITQL